ncbi:MAG: oligosaccharide flippase family protein [Gemmatimonadales bacterium]
MTVNLPAAPGQGWRGWLPTWERVRALAATKLARDHLLTLATELTVMAASLVVLKLAAAYTDTAGFGEFVLARRMIGLVQLPALCGIGLALTRSVAMATERRGPEAQWPYFDGALFITVLTGGFAALLLMLGAAPFAALTMGGSSYAPLARAIAPGVLGLVLHGVAYGLLRGRQTMVPANLVQALNLGVVPLVVFSFRGLPIATLVLLTGTVQLGVAILVLLGLRLRGPRPEPLRAMLASAGAELFRYGAPRVPGEFMLGALSALPVTAAAHYAGPAEAGRVGLGLSLLSLVGSLFAPLGQVMLPAISARVAAGRTAGLGRAVWLLVLACGGMTLVGAALLELLAPWLLPAVFGPDFAAAVMPVRIIVLGAVPYVVYIVLRNVLDAIHAAPLNAANLAVALGAFGAVMLALRSAQAVPYGVLAAMSVLGALTAWRTRRALRDLAT